MGLSCIIFLSYNNHIIISCLPFLSKFLESPWYWVQQRTTKIIDRAEFPVLKKAEKVKTVEPGEVYPQWGSYQCAQISNGWEKRRGSETTGRAQWQDKKHRFETNKNPEISTWTYEHSPILWGQSNTGMVYWESLWRLHPWRYTGTLRDTVLNSVLYLILTVH